MREQAYSKPLQKPIISKALRFGATGALTTALAYFLFMFLIARTHYTIATVGTWLPISTLGFLINRRFTFGLSGDNGRKRQYVLYLTGAVLQLFVAEAGYAVLFEKIGMAPTPAFCVNLVITTAFSFAFMNFVTFRTKSAARPSINNAAGV